MNARAWRCWAALFCAALPCLLCARAAAQDDSAHNVRLLAAVGYGLQDDGDAGAFGAAFGLKAGVTLADWIHLGAEGTFHIGSRFGSEQNRVQYYGLEAGARFTQRRVAFTPYLSGGIASIETQRNTEPSITEPYVALGASVDVVTLPWLLVGLDARYVLIPLGSQQGDAFGDLTTCDFLLLAGARL